MEKTRKELRDGIEVEIETDDRCKEPCCGQCSVIFEHRYIVNGGIEDWLWQQRCGKRLNFCGCIEYRLEWLSAHTGHHARPRTPKRCSCCKKAAAGELWSAGGPAVRRSRVGYQSSDDRVMKVGIGIVVDSCSSGRLPHDCDAGCVSAESADVISDPFNGLALV